MAIYYNPKLKSTRKEIAIGITDGDQIAIGITDGDQIVNRRVCRIENGCNSGGDDGWSSSETFGNGSR